MSQPQEPTPAWALFCADINAKTARPPRKPKAQKPVSANVSPALQILNALADRRKQEKNPNMRYPVKANYRDDSANACTTCIVDYVNFLGTGYFATRRDSKGTFRADIGRFVPSQQRAGMPDIEILVYGRSVQIEVKYGNDRLSAVQRETHEVLINAGAFVFTARTFQAFYEWFTQAVQPAIILP